jgi:hypothetical protein
VSGRGSRKCGAFDVQGHSFSVHIASLTSSLALDLFEHSGTLYSEDSGISKEPGLGVQGALPAGASSLFSFFFFFFFVFHCHDHGLREDTDG